MIILDRAEDASVPDTGERLQFFLGGAPVSQLPYLSSFVEFDDTQRAAELINKNGVSNSGTAVDLIEPPAQDGLERQLKALSIYNPNTAITTVTIQLDDNGTARIIVVVNLNQGDSLQYIDTKGFFVLDNEGNIKTITVNFPSLTPVDDQTDPTAATLTDAYTVPAGNTFEFFLTVANRGAATAFRWSIAIAGAADANAQYKAYDVAIAANDVYVSETYRINATDVIRVYATLATLSFGINGVLRPNA